MTMGIRAQRRLRLEELEPRIAPAVTYHIASVSDLQNMRLHLADNCVLDNDVNAAGFPFVPVGTVSAPFSGTFDGQGHKISNLTIDTTHSASPDSAGLFGYANSRGVVIQNLGLSKAQVTGGSFLGALVGNFFGEISNCYAEGVTIIGSGNYVGGLVGQKTGGTISGAYATGTIGTSSMGISVGGIAGDDWGGTISNSYAVVSLNGNINVGGLVGSEQGAIVNSYAAGAVKGYTNVGGLVGSGSGNVTGGYYDMDTTGQTGSAGGVGEHTTDMKMQSTFQGWDFTAVWNIHEGTSYPYLRWHPQAGAANYTGTPPDVKILTFRAGTPAAFQDDDGSLVRVSLSGPGIGTLTLANGQATWAQIDTLRMAGTTERSRVVITSTGGSVPGSSFKTMTIAGAPGAQAALGVLSVSGVDLAPGGRIAADGPIRTMALRDVGAASTITVVGSLNAFSARNVGGGLVMNATDDILRFTSVTMGAGAAISAGDGIGTLTVRTGVVSANIAAGGAAGIGRVTVRSLESSAIVSKAGIGVVRVNGNMHASSIAANIAAGTDGRLGTADDVLSSPGLSGAIGALIVRGTLSGSDDLAEHYGVVAHDDIRLVSVGGRRVLLPLVSGNITLSCDWR